MSDELGGIAQESSGQKKKGEDKAPKVVGGEPAPDTFRLSILTHKDLHKRFKTACTLREESMTAALERMMRKYIDETGSL